jgi:hypothetical protein
MAVFHLLEEKADEEGTFLTTGETIEAATAEEAVDFCVGLSAKGGRYGVWPYEALIVEKATAATLVADPDPAAVVVDPPVADPPVAKTA